MERYFDAFLYFANWGTHELMLRLPRRVLDPATAKRYCYGDGPLRGSRSSMSFSSSPSEEEGSEWFEEDEDGSLSTLVRLRADLASRRPARPLPGLAAVRQAGELDDGEEEPPCPPGLGRLSAALEAFVAFLRVDRDLLEAAAAGSAGSRGGPPGRGGGALGLGPTGGGEDRAARAAGQGQAAPPRRAAAPLPRLPRRVPSGGAAGRRTVAELREAAERRAEERRRREAERAARERARQEREAAEARERHLASLARREAEAWREVEALIATKQPGKYDAAVALLRDLRELAVRAGRREEVEDAFGRLHDQHAKKPSLVGRLRAAGLVGTGPDDGPAALAR